MREFDLEMLAVAQDMANASLEEDRKAGCVVVCSLGSMVSRSCNVQGKYAYEVAMGVLSPSQLKGATLYMTHEPSRRDGMRIAEAGIKRVVWQKPFDRIGSDVLRAFGVEVVSYEYCKRIGDRK